MTALYVVTLYPYNDGAEARYQFDTREMAEAFAAKVNALDPATQRDLVGNGDFVNSDGMTTVWESGTYESVEEAMEALAEWTTEDEEDDDA